MWALRPPPCTGEARPPPTRASDQSRQQQPPGPDTRYVSHRDIQDKIHFLSDTVTPPPLHSSTSSGPGDQKCDPAVTKQSLFNQTLKLDIFQAHRPENWEVNVDKSPIYRYWTWSLIPVTLFWDLSLIAVDILLLPGLLLHWRAFTIADYLLSVKMFVSDSSEKWFIISEWFQIQLMQTEIFKLSTRIHNPVASRQ